MITSKKIQINGIELDIETKAKNEAEFSLRREFLQRCCGAKITVSPKNFFEMDGGNFDRVLCGWYSYYESLGGAREFIDITAQIVNLPDFEDKLGLILLSARLMGMHELNRTLQSPTNVEIVKVVAPDLTMVAAPKLDIWHVQSKVNGLYTYVGAHLNPAHLKLVEKEYKNILTDNQPKNFDESYELLNTMDKLIKQRQSLEQIILLKVLEQANSVPSITPATADFSVQLKFLVLQMPLDIHQSFDRELRTEIMRVANTVYEPQELLFSSTSKEPQPDMDDNLNSPELTWWQRGLNMVLALS